ncbi:uncharacterized protein LOC128726400 [Anopheles nili]|uniref:uncharacterized protein LOC128726400 n=1 Tax=Anopheles nili TaxID=185578 RepID=UPI00237BFECD|nr:uncharacterized protein LOC128726400 [Anopheles nili]
MALKGNFFGNNLRPKNKTIPELSQTLPLPIRDKTHMDSFKIDAVFTGYSVHVTNPDSIRFLCLNGGFGQGMLSRAFPACILNFNEGICKRKRRNNASKVDSNYSPVSEGFSSNICNAVSSEPLCLFLEEAFFLMQELKLLELKTVFNKPIDIPEAFDKFRKAKRNFFVCYCAYLYLKSKNWIIKSGIKFGGDFVIYVRGPQFYHASYIVLIHDVLNGKFSNSHSVDGLDFQGLNRIAETTAKDILCLEVHYPNKLDISDYATCLERLKDVRIGEIFSKHHNYLAGRNLI